MKILIVGFEKFNESMYPHTSDIIRELQKENDVTYYCFRTRDILFIYRSNIQNIKAYILFLYDILKSVVIDTYELFVIGRRYNHIIASDQFIYLVASLIFPRKRVILWSLDIYPTDCTVTNKKIVRLYLSLQKRMLIRNKKVVIQDFNRLNVLTDLLNVENKNLSVYFFPISLNKMVFFNYPMCNEIPGLLQIGNISINGLRYSKELLLHYQNNHCSYKLFFHGNISKDFKDLLSISRIKPIISETKLDNFSIRDQIEKCDIGFLGYELENKFDLNGYYICNASGQLVEFIRMKKPVISLGNTDLAIIIKQYKIGIHLENIDGLNEAINEIMGNYKYYSDNSFELFEKDYCIDKYFFGFALWMS